MKVNVWFYGKFRELATRQRAVQLADDASLGDLMERLAQEYGMEFNHEMRRFEVYFIMVNGNYCNLSVNKERPLEDGDVVAFVPIVEGG